MYFVGAVFTRGSYRLYSLDCIHYRIVSGMYLQDDLVRLYFLEDVVRVVFTRNTIMSTLYSLEDIVRTVILYWMMREMYSFTIIILDLYLAVCFLSDLNLAAWILSDRYLAVWILSELYFRCWRSVLSCLNLVRS